MRVAASAHRTVKAKHAQEVLSAPRPNARVSRDYWRLWRRLHMTETYRRDDELTVHMGDAGEGERGDGGGGGGGGGGAPSAAAAVRSAGHTAHGATQAAARATRGGGGRWRRWRWRRWRWPTAQRRRRAGEGEQADEHGGGDGAGGVELVEQSSLYTDSIIDHERCVTWPHAAGEHERRLSVGPGHDPGGVARADGRVRRSVAGM